MKTQTEELEKALLYALRTKALFAYTKQPRGRRINVPYLIKWGAMRNLHRAIAAYFGEPR